MALLELFAADLATTTVASGGTDAPSSGTGETWTVASSAMFGAAQTGVSQFHVADTASGKGTEVIAVTNVSGTTWTVTRGADSTTPVTHAAGFTVNQVATAGWLGGLAQLASPALTGSPTAPTPAGSDSSTKLATTAFAQGAAAAAQAAAIAASLPTLTEVSVSTSGTLALNTITEVTAATALTMALPASVENSLIVVERSAASTANVAVTGNMRGASAQTITLQLASESEMFFGDGTTWWPVAGHKTLGSLQSLFLQIANNLSDLQSQQAALNNLAGAVTSGSYLRGNGTNVLMAAIQAGDVPTLNQSTTGSAGSFTGSVAGDVTGTQGSTTVGKVQGVAITAAQATLVSDLNNATARTATATLLPGEETIFSGSTASQTLTLPASPPSSSVNTITNAASVSVTVAPGSGATLSNFGTSGNIAIPAGYTFAVVYIGTTWYVQSAGPSDFAKNSALAIANGGTGQASAAAAYNALSPMTATGDIEYESGANTAARLAGNTSATKKFLTQTGTGSASAAPGWNTIAAGDIPTLNQSTTGTAAGLSSTLAIGSGGTGEATAAAAFANLAPLTTEGDLLYENATPAPARLPVGAVNTTLQSNGSLPSWQPALALQASTGAAGYALVNGTGNIITWTAPNDGNMHRVLLMWTFHIISAETGGELGAALTTPDGGSVSFPAQISAGGASGGNFGVGTQGYFIEANTTIAVKQNTALTSGVATLWAELWGS